MLRVPTGIRGLDEMLGGGFPKGRVILLCGGPGTGKTIFSLQFLANAAKRGEPGVYVTLEEPLRFIREYAESFGWDLRREEVRGRIKLLDLYMVSYGGSIEVRRRETGEPVLSVVNAIIDAAREIRASHVVIDPITSISIHEQNEGVRRLKIAELFGRLRRLGVTSLITLETSGPRTFSVEEFLADGVIRLEKTIYEFNLVKTIRIEKMRGLGYDEQPRRYTIEPQTGFIVYSTEPVRV